VAETVFTEGTQANVFSSIINFSLLNRILNDDEFNGVIEAIQYILKAIKDMSLILNGSHV